jgi:pyridoxal phosphate enzyme (YggS family)
MDQISKQLSAVTARVRAAAAGAHRDPSDVRLIAVSKTRTAAEIRSLYNAGVHDFGENYVQEALRKLGILVDLDICWHFVGALQSNKTREVAHHFDWVHTVDRKKIAQRLSDARPIEQAPLNLLIQVNLDAEPQKAGVPPEALAELLHAVRLLPRVRWRGLMAIPRPVDPGGDPGAPFDRLRTLFDECKSAGGEHWDTLSMGMSADFEIAISHGATLVRIGTALFGPRRS